MTRLFTITLYFIFVSAYCVSAQGVGNLVFPEIWYKVDVDSTLSNVWRDVSGNGHDAVLPNATNVITYINYNAAIRFSDQNKPAFIPYNIEGLSEITFIGVYQPSDTIERGIFGTINGLTRNIMITTNQVLGLDSVVDVFHHSGAITTLNTITQNWEDTEASGEGATLSLAGVNNESISPFNGAIAEFLLFDQLVPYLDRVIWETYLAIKYGVTLKSKNYVSSGEHVLWSAKDNQAFSHNITGIGHDDLLGLMQTRSKNAEDTTGLLLLSVSASNNDLADQSFLIWGDTGEALEATKGEGADSILTMLKRKWLMQASGVDNQNLTSSLQIDLKQFPFDSLGYWLVNDRTGGGNFSVDNLEYIKADSLNADSIAFFNNLNWDNDISTKDNFSFANVQPLFAVARTLTKPLCTDPNTGEILIEIIEGKAPYKIQWGLVGADERSNFDSNGKLNIDKLAAGIYSLKVSDAAGNQFIRTVVLEMANGLHVDLGPDQEYQRDKQITLDASVAIPDSIEVEYVWESSFGFNSNKPKITITESGIYRVFVTNKANGCVFDDEVVISGSPIERIEVFPNPIRHNDSFNLSVSLKEPAELEVKIFDLKGNLFQTLNGSGQSEYQFQIDLSVVGQYLLSVETPEGRKTKKIIVY